MSFLLTLCIAILLIATPLALSAKPIPQVMLASSKTITSLPYNTSGFYVSEKYDGVRAYWTGSSFLTRQGNSINAPDWFVKDFPDTPLDGELWIDRNRFDDVSAAIRRKAPNHNEWREIKYMVFDLPVKNLAFYQRYDRLQNLITNLTPNWLQVVEHKVFDNKVLLQQYFDSAVAEKAEGIMLNISNATYKQGRSKGLLKIKPLFDEEAIVTAHQAGKGKYKGFMGALWVRNNRGQVFKIGSGFSDEERKNPPKVGQIITYEYSGFSKSGLPRFARFAKLRTDLSDF